MLMTSKKSDRDKIDKKMFRTYKLYSNFNFNENIFIFVFSGT